MPHFNNLHVCIPSVIVEAKIGSGQDSTVYRARTYDGQLVALKMFKHKTAEQVRDEAHLQYLAWQAGISPKILSFGSNYIVMELLQETLFEVLRRQGFATDKQQRDLLLLLQRADNTGIFIDDANPGNFMYDSHQRPFIIDFGYAKQVKTPTMINQQLMPLGLMLQTKNICDLKSWKILKASLSSDVLNKYRLL